MKRSMMALGLAMMAGLVGLAACGKKADPNAIRFRFWGDLQEIQIIENIVKEFEAQNPGVKVKPERKTADATYADVLIQEFAANTAPDVMFVSTDNVELLLESGKLADLNPFLDKDPDLKADDYYGMMIKRFSKEGKLMVLPRDIAPIAVVYYNKALFDKAGIPYPKDNWTWDEMRATAKKLTLRDEKGVAKQLGFADDWNIADAWIFSAGGLMVDDYYKPTRFTFAEPAAIEGMLARWTLLQVDKTMPQAADQQGTTTFGNMALFLNGNLGMFHSGIWKTPAFREIKNFKWDVVRFPHKKGVKKPKYVAGGSGYTMRSDVANPEACWKFIKFLAGPVGQKKMAATGLAQPALKKMAKSEIFLDDKDPRNKKMLLEAAEDGLAAPAWLPWQKFLRDIWQPTTDPMWLPEYKDGPEGVKKILVEAQKKANAKYFPAK